jgi:hypothetical protein
MELREIKSDALPYGEIVAWQEGTSSPCSLIILSGYLEISRSYENPAKEMGRRKIPLIQNLKK